MSSVGGTYGARSKGALGRPAGKRASGGGVVPAGCSAFAAEGGWGSGVGRNFRRQRGEGLVFAAERVGFAIFADTKTDRGDREHEDVATDEGMMAKSGEVHHTHIAASGGGGVGFDEDPAVEAIFSDILFADERTAFAAQVMGRAEDSRFV